MDRITRMAKLFPTLMGRFGRLRAVVEEGMDLTYNQYKALLTIADCRECSLGDLARELDVAMSSASQMVDRLVGQQVVHREQDAGNRRQVVIRLTAEGERLIAELQRGSLDRYRQVLSRLPEAEQESLVQAFETIDRILQRLDRNKEEER